MTIKPSEIAPIYSLLFEVRFFANKVFGQETGGFSSEVGLADQLLGDGPVQFVLLERNDLELCFGGIVDSRIIEVWDAGTQRPRKLASMQEFIDFDEAKYLKVAAHFHVIEDGDYTRLEAETRVKALSPDGILRFAPYWYAIRMGGGLVRRAWLDGVKRKAES